MKKNYIHLLTFSLISWSIPRNSYSVLNSWYYIIIVGHSLSFMKLFAVFAAYLTNSFLSFRNLRSVIYKLILSTLTFFPFIWYNLPQLIKIGTSWKLISFRFIYEKCLLFKKNWYYKLLQMSQRINSVRILRC